MDKKVMVEVSARHIHLSQEHLEILFGKGYELTPKKDLSQPGQFACEERVKVVGAKKELAGVSILGPVRPNTQVEISLTDARALGISVPVRESGDIAGSAGVKLVGPAGEVEITEGAIAAKRHIHLDPETAKQLDVSDKQIVSAKVCTGERSLTFDEVVVRVSEKFAPAIHIDTDEANAACAFGACYGEIVK